MKLRTWDGKKQELSIAKAIYKEVDWADAERGELEDIRKSYTFYLTLSPTLWNTSESRQQRRYCRKLATTAGRKTDRDTF